MRHGQIVPPKRPHNSPRDNLESLRVATHNRNSRRKKSDTRRTDPNKGGFIPCISVIRNVVPNDASVEFESRLKFSMQNTGYRPLPLSERHITLLSRPAMVDCFRENKGNSVLSPDEVAAAAEDMQVKLSNWAAVKPEITLGIGKTTYVGRNNGIAAVLIGGWGHHRYKEKDTRAISDDGDLMLAESHMSDPSRLALEKAITVRALSDAVLGVDSCGNDDFVMSLLRGNAHVSVAAPRSRSRTTRAKRDRFMNAAQGFSWPDLTFSAPVIEVFTEAGVSETLEVSPDKGTYGSTFAEIMPHRLGDMGYDFNQ